MTQTLLKQYTSVWQNARTMSLLASQVGEQSCQCSVLTWFTLVFDPRSVQNAVDCTRRDGAVSPQLPKNLALLQVAKANSAVSLQIGAATAGTYTVFVCTERRTVDRGRTFA